MRRLSDGSARVVRHLLNAPNNDHYGYSLMKSCNTKSQTTYATLSRFETMGWVNSTMEAGEAGRPARKIYRVTKEGVSALSAELERYEKTVDA